VSERLPTLEARLRPTPLFGQTVFLDVLAQGGMLHTDRGPNQPVGTYDRFDLFPQISVPLLGRARGSRWTRRRAAA